jgi:phosphatidate phosphatase APP1
MFPMRLKKQPGRIVGQVVDRLLRKPVAGARVYLDTSRLDRSTTTDASGVYTITDVPAGPYTVVAEAEGFATRAKLAEVSPGRQVAAGFALDPSPETVASTDEVQGLVQ